MLNTSCTPVSIIKRKTVEVIKEELANIETFNDYAALGKEACTHWITSHFIRGGESYVLVYEGFDMVKIYEKNGKQLLQEYIFASDHHGPWLVTLKRNSPKKPIAFLSTPLDLDLDSLSWHVEFHIKGVLRQVLFRKSMYDTYLNTLLINDVSELYKKVVKATSQEAYKLLQDPSFVHILKLKKLWV